MSAIQREEILHYVNLARSQPQKFSEYVKQDIDSFVSDNQIPLSPNLFYMVNESKKAWLQCYDFLMKQKPLKPFEISQSLNLAAQDHAKDLAQNGITGHKGSDGSSLSDRVERRTQGQWSGSMAQNIGSDFNIQGRNHALHTVLGLIVDDGVPSRGHRKNIFSTQTNYIGIYSVVQDDKIATVMDFLTVDLPARQKIQNMTFKQPKYHSDQIPKIHQLGKHKKPQNFANFDKFNSMMQDGGIQQISQMHKNSNKYAVSTSKSTSTSIMNGKTTIKTIETTKYSDGSIQQKSHIEVRQ